MYMYILRTCVCVLVRVPLYGGGGGGGGRKKATSMTTLYHLYHYLCSFCPRQASTALEALLTDSLSDEVIQFVSLHVLR